MATKKKTAKPTAPAQKFYPIPESTFRLLRDWIIYSLEWKGETDPDMFTSADLIAWERAEARVMTSDQIPAAR